MNTPKPTPQVLPKELAQKIGQVGLSTLNAKAAEIQSSTDSAIATAIEQNPPMAAVLEDYQTADAVVEPLTLDEAVRAVVEALGLEEEAIKGLDIRPSGVVRIFGVDNSGRSARFTPLKRKAVGA